MILRDFVILLNNVEHKSASLFTAQLPIERLRQIYVTCLQKIKILKIKNVVYVANLIYKILRVYLSDSCSGCP